MKSVPGGGDPSPGFAAGATIPPMKYLSGYPAALLASAEALLTQGRIAVKLGDTSQMAEVTRLLESFLALA